jgi:flagellar hook-associated protein 2
MSSSISGSSTSANGLSTPLTSSTGFNSGLPIDDIITKLIAVDHQPIDLMTTKANTIKQQKTVFSNIQTMVQSLLGSIKTLTNRDVATNATIFDNMTASSTNATIASATASNTAATQTINLEVKKLPSLTVATSTGPVGAFSNATTVDELGITAGDFTIYANGSPYTIPVTAGETMGAVFAAINANIPDASVSADPTIIDGKVNIAYQAGANIVLGSGGDTTNFLSITNMLTGVNDGAGNITASQRNTTIDRNQTVVAGAAHFATPVTNGTFFINGVSFNTTGLTLNDLIDQINTSSAGVTAAFNKGNNTFQLSAKNTGSSYISLADGSSNFLTAMKLITGGDTTTSQVAGQNAQFVVNGTTMYASSTSVDETVTGLTGVTLNLNQAAVGTQVQLTVQKDTASVVTAVKDVIAKYNSAITYIDQQTDAKTKMPLASQSNIKNLRNQIRTMFTAQISALASSGYDSLQQIGISTGSVGSTAGTASPQLQLDATKLTAALAANPSAIKKLFVAQDLGGALNGTSGDDTFNGTFTQLKNLLTDQTYTDSTGTTSYGALYSGTSDSNRGLFAAYQASSQKRIDDLNKSISDAEARLVTKQASLRAQYLAMDKLVGQYQSQGTALNGLISQLSANGSSK